MMHKLTLDMLNLTIFSHFIKMWLCYFAMKRHECKRISETFTKRYRSKFNKNVSTDCLISKKRFI